MEADGNNASRVLFCDHHLDLYLVRLSGPSVKSEFYLHLKVSLTLPLSNVPFLPVHKSLKTVPPETCQLVRYDSQQLSQH